MKIIEKHLKLIILILVCLSIFYIYKYTNKEKIVYTAIGDGYSLGINSYNSKSYGYSDYIRDDLKKKGILYNYYQFAEESYMIKDLYNDILLDKKDSNGNNIKMVLRQTDLLTISIGINDLIFLNSKNSIFGSDKTLSTEIVDKIDLLFNEIKKYCKGKIYIIGYYNFYPQNSVEKKYIDNLNKKYKQLSVDKNIYYIDNSNMNNVIYLYINTSSSIYPNNYGYKKMYENFSKIYEK